MKEPATCDKTYKFYFTLLKNTTYIDFGREKEIEKLLDRYLKFYSSGSTLSDHPILVEDNANRLLGFLGNIVKGDHDHLIEVTA